MAKLVIKTSDGKEYPCRITMGAMIRFKRMTGRDISEMDGSVDDMATLIYCATASACAADGKKFEYTRDEFCDRLDSDEMTNFAANMQDGKASKKKEGQ